MAQIENGNNNWKEYKKLVMSELKRFNDYQEKLDKKLDKIIVDIATLKVKSGIWGFLGGALSVLIIILVWLMKGLL